MKIAVIATELSPVPGGIQRYTAMFASMLGKICGPSNVLVIPFDGKYGSSPNYLIDDRCATAGKVGNVLPRRWNQSAKLKDVLKKWKPDLIVCNHVALLPMALWGQKTFSAKLWTLVYGSEVWGKQPTHILKGLNASQYVVTISEYTAHQLRKNKIPDDKIKIVYFGIDTDLFTPPKTKQKEDKEFVLLTVCRLDANEKHKGYDNVLSALPTLVKKYPNIRYRIIGNGTDRERIEELSKKLNVHDKLEITGFVTDKQVIEYYQTSDLFVMPSHLKMGADPIGEGFGAVYLEAAACGKPVIGGVGGGCKEAIDEGKTGYLVDPMDQQTLIDVISQFIEDPAKKERMGKLGREWVKNQFSLERLESSMRALLNS